MRGPLAGLIVAATGALLFLGACRGGGAGSDGSDEAAPTELPAMSPGTIQAVGPHVFISSLESKRPTDDEPVNERLELVFQDITHYRLSRWNSGELALEEYRDADLFVFRRARSAFRWGQAVAGSSYLLDTIHPFERALGLFSGELLVREVETPRTDPEGWRRFSLDLEPHTEDPDWERRSLDRGHPALPLTLTGEVVTDEYGNRREAQLEGTFRSVVQGQFEPGTSTLVYFESRVAARDGVELLPPAAATPMILERKAERARVDTSKTAPIP